MQSFTRALRSATPRVRVNSQQQQVRYECDLPFPRGSATSHLGVGRVHSSSGDGAPTPSGRSLVLSGRRPRGSASTRSSSRCAHSRPPSNPSQSAEVVNLLSRRCRLARRRGSLIAPLSHPCAQSSPRLGLPSLDTRRHAVVHSCSQVGDPAGPRQLAAAASRSGTSPLQLGRWRTDPK
jgi:hypothetical protein